MPMARTRFVALSLVTVFTSVVGAQRGAGPATAAQPARAATATRVTPVELFNDPPTLINLGFEWIVDGDDNRNASVDVSYRKVGDATWKKGMPLLRLHHERVIQPNVFNLVEPNMFAGS